MCLHMSDCGPTTAVQSMLSSAFSCSGSRNRLWNASLDSATAEGDNHTSTQRKSIA